MARSAANLSAASSASLVAATSAAGGLPASPADEPIKHLIMVGEPWDHFGKYPNFQENDNRSLASIKSEWQKVISIPRQQTSYLNAHEWRSNATERKDIGPRELEMIVDFVRRPIFLASALPGVSVAATVDDPLTTTHVYYANIQTSKLYSKGDDIPAKCYSFNNEKLVHEIIRSSIIGPRSKVVLFEINEVWTKQEKATVDGSNPDYQLLLLEVFNPELRKPMSQLKSQIANLDKREKDAAKGSETQQLMKKTRDAMKDFHDTVYGAWIIYRRQLSDATDATSPNEIKSYLDSFRSTVTTAYNRLSPAVIDKHRGTLSNKWVDGVLSAINMLYNIIKNLTIVGAYHNYTRNKGSFFPSLSISTTSRTTSVELRDAVTALSHRVPLGRPGA